MNEILESIGKLAKAAAYRLANLDTKKKNYALCAMAQLLEERREEILQANAADVAEAQKKGTRANLIDRLRLDDGRIAGICTSLRQVAALPDPVGEVGEMIRRPNGLMVGKMRVPLGVVGIIYEARPNVTADAAALCLKTGNAVILRGGSEAIHSNAALVRIMQDALASCGIERGALQLIEDTSRDTAVEFMRMNGYLDVLIPRGGANLISTVVKNATVPVIETGTGNCHVYVDTSADVAMASDILFNAKTSRPSVCNACESLVVHAEICREFLSVAVPRLLAAGVEVRGCERARAVCADLREASEEDFFTEYLDDILSVKVVDDIDEAIAHINRHSTGHSESIVTKNYDNAQKFLREIDSAAVYVNASTRFTDGFEFGFGAEIGISTQKIHARGPMGLKELTTYKYIIYGEGQIRV